MSGRSYTRTGTQDPRSNPAVETTQRFLLCPISVARFSGVRAAKAIYHDTRPTSGLMDHELEGWGSRFYQRFYRSGCRPCPGVRLRHISDVHTQPSGLEVRRP